MPIKVTPEEDSLYSAEVTAPDGQWKSPRPMHMGDLEDALKAAGCSEEAIKHAIFLAFYDRYRPYAEETIPQLLAALHGAREVPAQSSRIEAWLTLSLIYSKESKERGLTIQDLLYVADGLNKTLATPDEISWVFIQLRKRDWLSDQDGSYSLTPEARSIVEQIVRGSGDAFDEIDRLETWMSAHPPGSDESTVDSSRKRS